MSARWILLAAAAISSNTNQRVMTWGTSKISQTEEEASLSSPMDNNIPLFASSWGSKKWDKKERSRLADLLGRLSRSTADASALSIFCCFISRVFRLCFRDCPRWLHNSSGGHEASAVKMCRQLWRVASEVGKNIKSIMASDNLPRNRRIILTEGCKKWSYNSSCFCILRKGSPCMGQPEHPNWRFQSRGSKLMNLIFFWRRNQIHHSTQYKHRFRLQILRYRYIFILNDVEWSFKHFFRVEASLRLNEHFTYIKPFHIIRWWATTAYSSGKVYAQVFSEA